MTKFIYTTGGWISLASVAKISQGVDGFVLWDSAGRAMGTVVSDSFDPDNLNTQLIRRLGNSHGRSTLTARAAADRLPAMSFGSCYR